MKRTQICLTIVAVLMSVSAAATQEKTEPTPVPTRRFTPLKVHIVFAKFEAEKKVASLPYTLVCNSDDRGVRLRMGIEVPVAVGVMSAGKEQAAPPSFQYKNVGTNIDCSARSVEDGRYKLDLVVEQSSIYAGIEGKVTPAAPVFRTFNSAFSPILRDGQTAQYTVATDPVNGEVVKIDVTMNVIK
jgi:hypothetical protein